MIVYKARWFGPAFRWPQNSNGWAFFKLNSYPNNRDYISYDGYQYIIRNDHQPLNMSEIIARL
jgi:hypothetical protein